MYEGHEIIIRRMGYHWEYLTVIKGRIFGYHAQLVPTLKNRVLSYLRLIKSPYSQKEKDACYNYMANFGKATIDNELKK